MSTPISPDLQACLLCEDVRQEVNGNFFAIGILGVLVVPALPITAPKLCIFSRWCCGMGTFPVLYRLILPDNTSVIASSKGELRLASVDDHVTQVTVFGNVQFQQEGVHWIEVHLENELKLRVPLPLKIALPRPQSTA